MQKIRLTQKLRNAATLYAAVLRVEEEIENA